MGCVFFFSFLFFFVNFDEILAVLELSRSLPVDVAKKKRVRRIPAGREGAFLLSWVCGAPFPGRSTDVTGEVQGGNSVRAARNCGRNCIDEQDV